MFDDIMKELTKNDKDRLILALNNRSSHVVRVGDKFVGVNTTAPTGYETAEIKGDWICGQQIQDR